MAQHSQALARPHPRDRRSPLAQALKGREYPVLGVGGRVATPTLLDPHAEEYAAELQAWLLGRLLMRGGLGRIAPTEGGWGPKTCERRKVDAAAERRERTSSSLPPELSAKRHFRRRSNPPADQAVFH